jgi:hypothetical protein
LIGAEHPARLGGDEVPMRTGINNVVQLSRWLALLAVCGVIVLPASAADREIIPYQAGTEALSENAKVLVGHWRKTTIVFESPRDEHLVLRDDGTAENWVVTASSRTETTTGRWSVEGKTLKLSLGENEVSSPFTIYEGQLVFPNIPNRRQFWEKIE